MKTLTIVAALSAAVAIAPAAHAGVPATGFSDTAVATGLTAPTAIAFLPDGRLLVTQQAGQVILVDGAMHTTLGAIDVCKPAGYTEMGLLGIAVDPNFTLNGFLYLYRTNGSATCGGGVGRVNEVVRVTKTGDTLSPPSVLLTGIRTDGGNHNGGVLRIGPDAKLYVGAGDSGLGDNKGGPGSATNPYTQDLGSLNGKVLRLNLDGTAPADNPFVTMVGARPEVWAYGLRNPFRMSFDPQTGSLWIGDVGDLTVEEIDIGTPGGNYGWTHCEGLLPTGCENPGDIDPILTYLHTGATSLGGCLIGGAFAGSAFGAFAGEYVFGDCDSNHVYHAALDGPRSGIVGTPAVAATNAGTPADFVEGPDGAIYYTANTTGDVRRLAAVVTSNDTLLAGKSLSLKANPTDATKKTMSVTSKDPAITLGGGNGSTDDPVSSGGSVRVVGTTFDVTYPMPAGSWAYIGKPGDGKGYKYKDAMLANGPVKTGMVKGGKLVKATGKGGGLGHTLATDPNPVSVVLTTGAKNYCMTFGGTTKFKMDRSFTAKNAAAPGACPP